MAGDLDEGRLGEKIGSKVPAFRFLESTGSTNSDALRWASEGAPEGALVVADVQTSGRGRLGRSWFGAPGGSINMSAVLRPRISLEEIGLVNLGAAVAVCNALGGRGVSSEIKWPNDVLIGGKKVCGILAEAQIHGDEPTVVLGVGINVNIEADEFPQEISSTATSLLASTGARHDRPSIIAAWLDHFWEIYAEMAHEPLRVVGRYRPLCSTLGRNVRIEMSDRIVEGKAADVDGTGALVLSTGEVIRVGDVIHLQ